MKRPPVRMPVRKKLLFAAGTVIAFFAAVEVVLSLAGVRPVVETRDPFVGFAARLPLFVEKARPDGTIVLETARNKLPWFNEQRFSRHKPAGSYRIFCLGGSTTYGRPYEDTTSFAGWLRELLPEADPSRKWEVVNAGGISYASYRVAAVMEELVAYDPDLFIVYCGQNEFLEERTYRSLRRLPRPVQEAAALLARTRTYAAVSSVVEMVRPGDDARRDGSRFTLPAEVDAVLDRSVGPTDYRRDDAQRRRILEHFELNLSRMVDVARSAGARVIFVVPASNLADCSPFKSQHRDGLSETARRQFDWLFQRGRALQKQEQWDEALSLYRQAAQLDDRFAELHYRIGRSLSALGRFDEARSAFLRAIDEDVCPLRAPGEVAPAIVRVARRRDVPVIDFPEIVSEASRRGSGSPIPGSNLFLDHVHPTVEGHRLLATALVDELIRLEVVEPNAAWPDEAVAATTRRIQRRISPELQGVALRNLAKVLAWAGKHEEAGPLALKALDKLPGDPESTFLAACYLKMTGRTREAVEYFRRALPHRGDDPQAHQLFADVLVEENDREEALVHYARALQLGGDDPGVHHRMGIVLAEQGRFRRALSHYRLARREWPDNPHLNYNLAVVLARLGRAEEARFHYREALRVRPGFPEAHNNLGILLAEQGRLEEAVDHYREALRLKPDYEEAQQNLDTALAAVRKYTRQDSNLQPPVPKTGALSN